MPLAPSLALALLLPAIAGAGEINFIYPPEGASIPEVAKTFVFGNISPATAPFTINGEPVKVHSNGGFIAYLPIAPGDFVFAGALADGTTAQRRLKVKGPPAPKTDDEEIWLTLSSIGGDTEVQPGEYVRIQAAGAPGMEAVYSIAGLTGEKPLQENPPRSGRYSAFYRAKPSDSGLEAAVVTRFITGLFRKDAQTQSRGKLRVLASDYMVETATDTVILRNASEGGYMLFLPRGVKLVINGRANGMLRAALAAGETGWVRASEVQPLPDTLMPAPPFTETGALRLKKVPGGVQAQLGLYEKVPFAVEETPGGLRLTLYYASLRTNWVVYDSSDTFTRNVAFRQAGTAKVEFDFETSEPVWGYNASYNARGLLLELRQRPVPQGSWPKPLAGLNIVVDPGHSPKYTPPYDGAIGPKGSFEFQANMAISLKLQEKLLALGATAQLTRTGDAPLSLADRPKTALAMNGDLFISVHNNAIGDGEDPWAQPRGFSVYYYHRHSRDLASAIHRSYVKNIALPDEGLRYGDYLVARMTWMPAVLLENAYMIFPEQEELLRDPAFQEKLAQTIAEGVLNHFGVPPAPAPRPAQARPQKAPPEAARPAPAAAAVKAKVSKQKSAGREEVPAASRNNRAARPAPAKSAPAGGEVRKVKNVRTP
jgi:N-acetylmuramoyl-L-alanine amidase